MVKVSMKLFCYKDLDKFSITPLGFDLSLVYSQSHSVFCGCSVNLKMKT